MRNESDDTITLSREIHDCCQQLEQTELDTQQKLLLKTIDDLAFSIFTRPKISLVGESDGI